MSEAKPTLMRRRLGLELKRLRGRCGLNLPDAAAALELSGQSTLSKIENGKQRVPPPLLEKFFKVYGLTDKARQEEIKKLASVASSGRRTNLLKQYRDAVPDPFIDYLELEELATHADAFAAQIIPGLLQTDEYAHAVVDASNQWRTPREVRNFVELRSERKGVLRRDSPLSLWCILDEAALRRSVGGQDVLTRQLQHLLDIHDDLQHVQIQVLPFSAGAHTGVDGSHTIFRFASGTPIVVVEPLTTSLYLEEDDHVGRYDVMFNHLRGKALDTAKSRAFIRRIIKEQS